MKTVRFALSTVVLLLLAVGYLASQYFYFDESQGRGARAYEYALRVDQPEVVNAALVIFLLAIVLAFVRNDQEGPEES